MRYVIATAVVCALAARPSFGQTAAIPTPLTYGQALDVAMSRNLGLAAARRQRAIREAGVQAARQIPNPEVNLELTQDLPHQVVTFGLPLEIGGRRARRIDVANEELTLADVDVRAGIRDVRREVRQAFYSLIGADERVRLADDLLQIARRVRDAAQARFETGAAPRLEVLQADLGVTRAETDADLARSSRAAAQASLNAVLNLPPTQPLVVAGSLFEAASAVDYQLALATAIQSNVDLVSLDRQIAVEERRTTLLRAERTPAPVFSVSALFNNQPDYTSAAGLGIGFTVPLFSRNQGEIAQSLATVAELRARRESVLRDVENNVFGTVARIDAQRRQLDAYTTRLVPTAADLEALAEESYRAGRTPVLALLDAQRNLRDLRREALQAAVDLQMSLADLEELLGSPIP